MVFVTLCACLGTFLYTKKAYPQLAFNFPFWVKRKKKPKKTVHGKTKIQKQFKIVPKPSKKTYQNEFDQYIEEKIDPILDKIALSGIESLSKEEKKILEKAKEQGKE